MELSRVWGTSCKRNCCPERGAPCYIGQGHRADCPHHWLLLLLLAGQPLAWWSTCLLRCVPPECTSRVASAWFAAALSGNAGPIIRAHKHPWTWWKAMETLVLGHRNWAQNLKTFAIIPLTRQFCFTGIIWDYCYRYQTFCSTNYYFSKISYSSDNIFRTSIVVGGIMAP